jgi:hypothetical protein
MIVLLCYIGYSPESYLYYGYYESIYNKVFPYKNIVGYSIVSRCSIG